MVSLFVVDYLWFKGSKVVWSAMVFVKVSRCCPVITWKCNRFIILNVFSVNDFLPAALRKVPAFSLLRGRFWGFSPRRGDTLHQWRWNLAWRRGIEVPRMCSRSSITMPSLVGLGFNSPPSAKKRWVFFICLSSVTFLNVNSLCTRFRHEGVGVQKRFWCPWIGESL